MELRKTRQRLLTLETLNALGVSHGFEIASKASLKMGTVYGVLIGFEQDGCVESSWELDPPAGRPRRRLYRLTARGHDLLVEYQAHFGPQVSLGPVAAVARELKTAIDQVWGGMFQLSVRREKDRQQAAARSVKRRATSA